MKRVLPLALMLLLAIAFAPACLAAETSNETSPPVDVLTIYGTVSNLQGKPVKDAEMGFLVNGKRIDTEAEITTSDGGRYEAKITLPRHTLPGATVQLSAHRASYQSAQGVAVEHLVKVKNSEHGNATFLARQNVSLTRTVTPGFWIATLILIVVYVLIALELLHRTLAAFLGAALILTVNYAVGTFFPGYSILTFEDAMQSVDMNVIFLLMGMMIIVGILKKTGVFQWMAYKSYQLARGNVLVLSAILMFVTAITSAFLDNVTTMLLIIPVTIQIALTLKIDPVTLLLPEVFASNVGGTATLIGDPPNIMIGSYAKLSFVDFVQNLSIVCAVALVFTLIYYVFWYKRDYMKAQVGDVQELIAHLREEYRITNKTLLIQSGTLLGITIFLFIAHGTLHMEPSIAAMIGAAVLMVISKVDITEMLEHEIEWPTLVFFVMLFIVVAGAEETGLIQVIADWVKDMSQGSLVVAILLVLWVAAIASAFIDNIPFTATMLPIVAYLTKEIPGAEGGILWWALALGACLGGNGTMIGASANVVTVGMAERAGYHISFLHYMRIAFMPMIATLILCSVWLLLMT